MVNLSTEIMETLRTVLIVGCNVGYDVAVQEIAEQVFEIINRSENKGE